MNTTLTSSAATGTMRATILLMILGKKKATTSNNNKHQGQSVTKLEDTQNQAILAGHFS